MSMNVRNIRVEDDLWNTAVERAKTENTNLSKLIRQWLADYNAGDEHLSPRPDSPLAIIDQLSELLDALRAGVSEPQAVSSGE